MNRIFLINVGANLSNRGIARSPIFPDGTFVYVSFPVDPAQNSRNRNHRPYPPDTLPFVRANGLDTHDDPDWFSLTYGDNCGQPRAAALKRAIPGDVLLFWALLWQSSGAAFDNTRGWADFTGEYNWYLIGTLRIAAILEEHQGPRDAPAQFVDRASRNVHCTGGPILPQNRVFIGDEAHSARFRRAVDLGAREENGLVYRVVRQASGDELRLHGSVQWFMPLRTVRCIWDLSDLEERNRAQIARDAILVITGHDLLKGLI